MSDLTVTVNNLGDLLSGKINFNQFEAGEAAMFQQNIASLAAPLQPAAQLALSSLKTAASSLVGAGLTDLGPLLAESTDTQATQVLNLLTMAGVPTNGLLSIAERAALTTIITGLKAGLDRIGLQITAPTAAVKSA